MLARNAAEQIFKDWALNTINGLVQALVAEKIDNPYLRALIQSTAQTFQTGVMQFGSPEKIASDINEGLSQSVPGDADASSANNLPAESAAELAQTLGWGAQQ